MFTRKGALALVDPEFTGRILIFGDIHGDLKSLQRGIGLRGPRDLHIFLGDYADRGPEGVEVIEGILHLMERIPDRILALMGNHELYDEKGRPAFMPCTLIDEAERKRGSWEAFLPTLRRFTQRLALAALIPGCALCVHGGISSDMGDREKLASPEPEQRTQILWGDPGPEKGESPGPRGAGRLFGPDVSRQVLDGLKVPFLIRSHEPRKAWSGPAFEHGDRVVTTSSTSVYGGRPFVLVIEASDPPRNRNDISTGIRFLD